MKLFHMYMRELPLSKYHFDKMNLRKQIQHWNETTRVMHTCEKKNRITRIIIENNPKKRDMTVCDLTRNRLEIYVF